MELNSNKHRTGYINISSSDNKVNKINMKHLRNVIILLIAGVTYYFIKKYTGFAFVCVLNEIFGIACFGCGITRMIFSIIDMDFYQAFRYNMVIFICFPFFLYTGIRSCLEYIQGKDFGECYVGRFCVKYYKIIIVIIILWMVIRNIFPYCKPTVV